MPKSNIFLSSSIHTVAKHIAQSIGSPKKHKLTFVYTGAELGGLNRSWVKKHRQALVRAGFQISDYTLTGKSQQVIKRDLSATDIILMEGGNTCYLLQQIQQTKSASVICDLVKRGKIYIGSSAGSIVAGPNIHPYFYPNKTKDAPKLKGSKGLGLVDISIMPHWGRADKRRSYLNHRLAQVYNAKSKIILLTDNQYLVVENNSYRIVDIKKEK